MSSARDSRLKLELIAADRPPSAPLSGAIELPPGTWPFIEEPHSSSLLPLFVDNIALLEEITTEK
jgi:hypothetical protein